MRISVIIAAYNAEAYIAEAVESVLGQTRAPDEVIVVNDGSTDRTRAVLDRFGGHIACLSQPNRGQAAAVNRALATASGDALSFCDADDVWMPQKLALQIALLDRFPEIDAVFGQVEQFVSPDVPEQHRARLQPPNPIVRGEAKLTMLVRRAALDRIGPFDEALPATFFIEWLGRAKRMGLNHRYVDDTIARRRLHLANGGRTNTDAQNIETLMALRQAIKRSRPPD
ncbi:glycosyltransferase family 2 protein [Bradyrhizobium diazoefficiens]|nr:glycosyltransferase family A protein [Bradyrhizobium diazoefficiens]MBR0964615.1 glycosyltransferase family 2 protein [Bradyrhizobium diazoefficiens]MBR0978788.1 glycosyltransferase family 2 protein [Bradyrhizobium diazoefficiens]MBR1006602.1 glycosyltransferase family 2 protein [Bradyrhizobium diazoefficiens]MBR1014542.1 glycosyltransferase family 2 protein [Bradyrhizobium diazoefficiens]MBR1051783.1 glycosyltransferase family 2 protein [Bradyrhizobium diazoefficiens]